MRTQDCAIQLVGKAVKVGKLVRPNQCEICGKVMEDTGKKPPIVAHHWNGYDDALNVWWICRSCNRFLLVHDGSMNIEQARVYVRTLQKRKLFRGC